MTVANSRVFSSVTLHSGIVRMIGALAWPGETPHVCITRYDGGRRIARTAFHCGPALDALVEAVRRATDPQFRGREVIALLPHGSELELEVAVAHAPHRGTAVTFIRICRDGERVGGLSIIGDTELASLAHACTWAREAALRPPDDVEEREKTTAVNAALGRTET